MPNLNEIEAQVAALPPEEFDKFRQWFEEFQADLWDQQIEADSLAGRLDALVDQAKRDEADGKLTPL